MPEKLMAFPQMERVEVCEDGAYKERWWPVGGMELRDWFAGQALAILHDDLGPASVAPSALPDWRAARAYRYADAMLKAREAK